MTPTKQTKSDLQLENERLREKLEARTAELAVLSGVQAGLASNMAVDEIFELVGNRIAETFPGHAVSLFTYDSSTGLAQPRFLLERGVRHYPGPIRPGPIGRLVMETKEAIIVSTQAEFEALGARTIQGTAPSLSGIYAPLAVQDRHIGAMHIENPDRENAFSESDLTLVKTLASSLSVALENVHLLNETKQRAQELSIINSVQEALVAKLDMQAIYDAVGDRIHEVFPDAQVVDILNYDAQDDHFHPRYVIERGKRYEVDPWKARGFRKHVVDSGEPLVINENIDEMAEKYDNDWVVVGEFSKSWLGVPMRVGDEVTGVISLQHLDQENAFSESDVSLLQTLANSMSVALDNVRLFDETTRLLQETEARNAELAIINTVQQALASELDIQSIYEAVGEKLREIFDSQVIAIYSADIQKRIISNVYVYEKGRKFAPVQLPFNSMHDFIIETNNTIVRNGNFPEFAAQFPDYQPSQGELPRSIVIVPVQRKKDPNTFITLTLQDVDGDRTFTESDVRLLETLASSMGVALENARLFAETQRLLQETEQRAAELQIVNSVQEGLASKLDMQAIYDLIGEKIQEIFHADTTFIAFHDVATDRIISPYYNDRGARTKFAGRRYGKGLAENVIESGVPLLLGTSDEMHAAGAYEIASPGSDKDLNESFLGVPILREGKAIGVTSVQSYQQHAFTNNDLTLLQTLANSMSVALENARLFDETQRLLKETEQRATELATINTVGQALVAESDLDALIDLIGEQMRQTFKADIVYVALLEPESQMINFPYTYGEEFNPLPLGEGLTSRIIESGEPLLINNEMDRRREEMGVTRVGKRARSYLGVPIQMGGRTFGVISVQSTSEEGIFYENDLHILSTIAANVSAAIRNAQLFEEIKRQKQYYEAVIENSPVAIVLLDLETNVTGWNPAAEKLFGYLEEEALGRNVDDLVANHPDLHAEAVRYSEKALREKHVHLLTRRTRKDGSLVEVDVSGLPVSVDGEYVGFIAIYHDVSELQRARQTAEEANRAKSTFLANMSHELRTPLNAIIGFTRIVKRKGADALPEKQVENLDKVLVSAEHLLSLINTVLDISKIEAGRLEVKSGEFDLGELVEQVVGTTQPLIRESVELSVEVPGDLPLLDTDQEKLKQILINLLSNAAKFTHKGEIRLRAWSDAGCLYMAVSDSGIGIPADAIDKIFDEFQQADSSTTRQYGGTGLGLSISRSLARLLGGELTVSSKEGDGSTFTLSLPLIYSQPPSRAQDNQSGRAKVEISPDQPLVLVIDDDLNVHDLLSENLGEHGYQVIGASSAEEGLWLAHDLNPFAITLDIMMPNKDGWQVLHELKVDPSTRDIPVVLLTIVDKQSLGYQLGAADYLVKPLDEGALQAALQRIQAEYKHHSINRILVVDDDPNIADLIHQLLETSGYQIMASPDGKDALEIIQKQPPDLLLLDLMMPRMDGFELIEALNHSKIQLPVIVLTAKDLSSDEVAQLEGSVERIILKNGLDREQLMKAVEQSIEDLRKDRSSQSVGASLESGG